MGSSVDLDPMHVVALCLQAHVQLRLPVYRVFMKMENDGAKGPGRVQRGLGGCEGDSARSQACAVTCPSVT